MPRVKIGLQIEETSPLVRHLIGSGKGSSEWDGIDPDEIVKVTHTVESSDIQEINPGIYYNIPSITTAKQGDTLFSDDGRLFVYDEPGSRWFLWYTFDNTTAKIHTNNTLKGEGTLDDPLSVNATVVALKGDLNPLLEGTDNGDGTYTFTSADGSTMFTIDPNAGGSPVNLFTDDLTLTENRTHDLDDYTQLIFTSNEASMHLQGITLRIEQGGSLDLTGSLYHTDGSYIGNSVNFNISNYIDSDNQLSFIFDSNFGMAEMRRYNNLNNTVSGFAAMDGQLLLGDGEIQTDNDNKINVALFRVSTYNKAKWQPLTIPEYATDADADNDSDLAANAPYSVAGDRVVRTKSSASPFNPSYGYQTLTDAANISWDMDLGEIAKVTITDNRTLSNPTNLKTGTYVLFVIQDGVGGHTLSFDTNFKWKGGIAPTMTAAANAVDILTFVSDGTFLYGAMTDDYS